MPTNKPQKPVNFDIPDHQLLLAIADRLTEQRRIAAGDPTIPKVEIRLAASKAVRKYAAELGIDVPA